MKTLEELAEEARKGISNASFYDCITGLRSLVYEAEYNVSMLDDEEHLTEENKILLLKALINIEGASLLITTKLLQGVKQ